MELTNSNNLIGT